MNNKRIGQSVEARDAPELPVMTPGFNNAKLVISSGHASVNARPAQVFYPKVNSNSDSRHSGNEAV